MMLVFCYFWDFGGLPPPLLVPPPLPLPASGCEVAAGRLASFALPGGVFLGLASPGGVILSLGVGLLAGGGAA